MKYLYAAYVWIFGVAVFMIIATISIIGIVVTSPRIFSPVFKFLLRILIKLMFIRVEITGKEKYDKTKTYLIMPNHVSFMDAVFLSAYLPSHTIAIEEKSHFKWPFYGWLTFLHGNVPINRTSIIGSKKSFELGLKKLESGINLIIFPEGGRTVNGKMRPFKKLPFMMAQQSTKDIMPIGMEGIYEMNNKNSYLIKPIKIRFSFGDPIPNATVIALENEELVSTTRSRILEMLDEGEA